MGKGGRGQWGKKGKQSIIGEDGKEERTRAGAQGA